MKNYNAKMLPYCRDFESDCKDLYERWAKKRADAHRDDIYCQMLKENALVHNLALREHRCLGLIGRVVVLDGKPISYTFGYSLDQDTFCILFEITDLEKKGLAVFTFREFCADQELDGFKFINTVDDFGMDNIRTTKLSFGPCRVVPSFVVSRKSGNRCVC